MELNLLAHSSCGMDLTDAAQKSDIFAELETVKVGGSDITGLQQWVGPVPPTFNGSDAHETEQKGETVTLRCDIYGEGVTSWSYSWYKEDSTSVFSDRQEHTFSFVNDSDAGKYSCKGSETEGSRWSQMSDAVTLTVSDSRSDGLKPIITGVTAGLTVTVLIIVFLILLWRYRNNKGGRSQSPSTVSQQQNNSQTSDQNHSEAGYNTLQSGTAHIYDSVDAAVKDISTDSVSESTEHIYAEIELKSTKKQKKKKENKENKTESPDCIYSNLMLQTDQGAGSSDVTYAQVN
ncbi:V-set and transmembrane domain-containing protein 1-like [Labeo rohita]|uniref:V-set and transmembrane domain-containing protein 1-like n=1 Tax=Labeo rohita TaxID=84645 RepID=UPI0021E2C5B2|nr:V-set and transmembrane domain-containing protein 1-like [Labeo rohita]